MMPSPPALETALASSQPLHKSFRPDDGVLNSKVA